MFSIYLHISHLPKKKEQKEEEEERRKKLPNKLNKRFVYIYYQTNKMGNIKQ